MNQTNYPLKPLGRDTTTARFQIRSVEEHLRPYLRLAGIWLGSGTCAFVLVMVFYTLFIGRNQAEYNVAIYKNYRLTNRPHSRQLYTHEGYGITSYGEEGLVVDKTLDPSRPQILFIGSSYVEAKHVSDPDKFTERVERDWNAVHPDNPIQTLNAGAPGEDMPTYLSFGRNMDRRFSPDLVFVLLNSRDFEELARHPERLVQFATDPETILVKPQKLGPISGLASDTIFRMFFARLLQQAREFIDRGDTAAAEAELSGRTSVLPDMENSVEAQLRELQRIWGDRLVIIYDTYIPNYGQGVPAAVPEDSAMRAARKLGIPLISLYAPLLEAYRQDTPPRGFHNSIMGEGHFNQTGHAIVAGEVLRYLEDSATLSRGDALTDAR